MHKLLAFLWAFSSIGLLDAQCLYDNTFHSSLSIPTCPSSATATCVYGGQYVTINVQNGFDYTISTCNQATFDTQLSVYDATGATLLAYNDDYCNLQSQVSFTAASNGVVHLLLDRYNCQNNSNSCADITVNCVAPIQLDSSNLPIVVINTSGVSIPDDNKISATMGIIYNGEGVRNYISDPFNHYNGNIGIETRGSSSAGFPKKQWGVETRDPSGNKLDVSLFDMAYDNDWVLYAPYSDKSLIRNVFTYKLGWDTENYAPRTQLCEVVLNGSYQGIYVLIEKIKRRDGKVGINSVLPTDLTGNELTGDYILKIDKTTSGGIIAWNSPYPPFAGASQNIGFQLHDPDISLIDPIQQNYIKNFIDEFEAALNGPNFTDPLNGYAAFIDVPSFIDYMLVNELTRNVDGYRLSAYLHKRRQSEGGKLYAGPLWDFNLALGNADYCNGGNTSGWETDFNQVCGGDNWQNPFWWKRLLQDPTYTHQLNCRWKELRQDKWHLDTLLSRIDSLANYLDESQVRNFQKWPILNTYVWPNNVVAGSYPAEINYLKLWLTDRINWMDANMHGSCLDLGIQTNNPTTFKVYPNPATNTLFVEQLNSSESFELILSDINGREQLRTTSSGQQMLSISLASLSNGMYFYTLRDGKGNIVNGNLLKQ